MSVRSVVVVTGTNGDGKMTWSIVAYDESTGAFGVAVASKFFAVGAYCPCMKAGAGAVSTQSLVNPLLGLWSIRLLEAGLPAPETSAVLPSMDLP